MSVFGSIFGKKGFEKGSQGVAFTAGAHSPRPRPGRSGSFPSITPRARRIPARPETEHNIGGAPPRALSPRRWAMPSGMSPQTGRSMIEMLAVLAIMGVLTVGGIAAYSFAVAKHRANQIYNQVDLRAVTAFSNPIVRQTQIGNTFFLPGFDDTFENLPYEHSKIGNAAFQIKVTNVPRKVCRRLQDMTFKLPRQVTLNGEDVSSACGVQNTFVFVYDGLSVGKPSNGVDPIDCDCSGCQSCETGTCQDNDNLCGPKEVCVSGRCQCASDYTECRGGCYTACGDGLMRDPISCDCVCEPQECPAFANWDETTCSCQCQSPLTYDAQSNTCECPADAPYYFEDANLCCQSGYTPVDGVCQKIDCRGGPTNYDCYINDIACGYNCDSLGRNCQIGICNADECASDEPFTYADWMLTYKYRCHRKIDNQMLCARTSTTDNYKCFYQHQLCMWTNSSLVQQEGTCDPAMCTEISSTAQYTFWGDANTMLGSCDFGDNLICYPRNNYSLWDCFKNGYRCGSGCTDPLNCGNCQTEYCMNGMTYNAETGYCEDTETGVYCTTTTGTYYQSCYQKNGEICETVRSQTGTVYIGSCTDPGCPDGMVYGYISSGERAYGCVDENIGNQGIACYFNAGYSPNICYYNGSLCGRRCDYNGTNCGMVYLPQCALAGHCPQTGYAMTDGCTCDGNVTSVDGINYCCPAGHTYTNGTCAIN